MCRLSRHLPFTFASLFTLFREALRVTIGVVWFRATQAIIFPLSRRFLAAACWAVPPLLCLALYWPGLLAWFQQDDFAWLNLPNQAHGWGGLLRALFAPTVHGTWRPLSERAFFLGFGALFGADALPYRIWVFLTQFANLALLASLTTRLTKSRAAGLWAAILWIANSKLATVMSWTCEYILVACAFFLLLALHLFVRYTETGERRFYLWMWAAFLTGFLAMETNLVFPLLAGSYALLCARKYFRPTLPCFAVSAAYGILHLLLAPNRGTQVYALHLDAAIPATFFTYWRRTFEPADVTYLTHLPALAATLEMAAATVALLAFTIYQARRRQWLALVFLAWYAFTLAPVLPLRDHIMDYYLTLPAMCLAMLAAHALVSAWRAGTAWRALSAALAAGFLLLSLPVAWSATDWYRRRSSEQQTLVMGVAHAHELHPGKLILLDGIDDEVFRSTISQRPFLFLNITDVYLTPGSEARITPEPGVDISKFVLSAEDTRRRLKNHEAVVYRAGKGPLKNITRQYLPPQDAEHASGQTSLDMGSPLVEDRLGPSWYERDAGFRWMPRTAKVHISGPRAAGAKLYLTGFCPITQLSKGPLGLTVTVDGIRLAPARFTKADTETTFAFDLPAETAGKSDLDITLEVSRTVRIGADRRDLGIAVSRLEIR